MDKNKEKCVYIKKELHDKLLKLQFQKGIAIKFFVNQAIEEKLKK